VAPATNSQAATPARITRVLPDRHTAPTANDDQPSRQRRRDITAERAIAKEPATPAGADDPGHLQHSG
jgi:hypothetical protein